MAVVVKTGQACCPVVKKRKILIFAHTPPPHHGQSVMVELLLDALGSDPRFEVHHVDVRVSDNAEDIGSFRPQKFWRLLQNIFLAWGIRFKHGSMAFYYVPAPVKKSAILRDWFVMALCRPFFPELILHWHAIGLGAWAADPCTCRPKGSLSSVCAAITRGLLGHANLSIAISPSGKRDAELLSPRRITLIANGITDPCGENARQIRIRREAKHRDLRLREGGEGSARENSGDFTFLFMAHCTEDKGLFDALHALELCNTALAKRGQPLRAHLVVAGQFANTTDKSRFDAIIARPDVSPYVRYAGFVSGDQKHRLLEQSDCLLFPTHWDNFPTAILEAMAYDLPVMASDFGSLPAMFPHDYKWIFPVGSAEALSEKMMQYLDSTELPELRQHYLANYTEEIFSRHLREELLRG